jgi:hypothetical protein
VPAEFIAPRQAATSTAPPVTTPPIPSAPAPAPARKPAERRPKSDSPSGRPGWLVPAAVAVVVLLLLGIGAIVLANRGGSTNTQARHSPGPTASPKASASPTNAIQQVPVYAPAAAAPVTSVVIDPANSNCQQVSGACKLEVDIKFSSVQRSNVSFIVKFFDRCTGTTTDLPGASFTPPGFTLVILDKTVTLPAGAKSAAVVVVTQNPAAAASAPILLGADSC